jgi:hypothetical protein
MPELIAQFQNQAVTSLTHRVVRVEVEVGQETVGEGKKKEVIHNTLIFDGLNVRFNILKMRGVMQNKCDIAICNLNKEQVEYLTTINSWQTPQNMQKVLRVWAGYRDDKGKENVGLIFQGDIIRAFPTTEPDVWLECNCLSGYLNQLKTGTLTIQGKVSVRDICTKAAALLGLSLDYQAKSNKTVNGFYHAGGLTQLIKELDELDSKITVYQDNETLIVADAILEENKKDASGVKEGQMVRVYNQLSGLISHPEPDPAGVKFKVLLDPSLKCGETVKLESDMIPAANGVYWIYSIRHFGELRGQAFYSEINARSYVHGG